MNWEVFAYWNVQELTTVFNAVAALVGSNDFHGLLRTVALVFFISLALTILARRAAQEDFIRWLVMLSVFNGFMLVPKVSVSIVDRTGTTPPAVVANVPLGLAALASSTSKIGDWLTRAEEALFSLPSDVRFVENGTLWGHRIMRERLAASAVSPVLSSNLVEFYRECVWPDIATGYLSMADIAGEEDIWEFLNGKLNPGLYVQLAGEATPRPCQGAGGAYEVATAQLNTDADENLAILSRKLYPGMSAALAKTTLTASLQGTSSYMLGTTQGAQAIMRQAIIGNSIIDAGYQIPAQVGDAATAAVKLAEVQAIRSFNTSNQAMVALSDSTMPRLRNVVELLIYALFPIVTVLIVAAGHNALPILKSYLGAMLWVQLWPPLYAIMNFAMNVKASAAMNSMTAGEGLALKYYSYLGQATVSDQAVAGVLTVAIPVIAYGIVHGIISFAGQLGAVAQPAGQYGANLSQGNLQFGSSNINATKMDMATQGQYSTQPIMRGGTGHGMFASSDADVTTTGSSLEYKGRGWSASAMDTNHDGQISMSQRELMAFKGEGFANFGSSADVGISGHRGSTNFSGDQTDRGSGTQVKGGTGSTARLTDGQRAELSRMLTDNLQKVIEVADGNSHKEGSGAGVKSVRGTAGSETSTNTENFSVSSQASIGGGADDRVEGRESHQLQQQGGGGKHAKSLFGPTTATMNLSRKIMASIQAGISGGATTGTQNRDEAKKLAQNMSEAEIRDAYEIVKSTLDKTARGTTDAAVKQGAESLGATLDRTTTYSRDSVGSLMDSVSAGHRDEAGRRNAAGVKVDSSMDLFYTAWGMLAQQRGWDDTFTPARAAEFTREWNNNASFREDAAARQYKSQEESPLMGQGVNPVKSQADIKAQGVPTVADNTGRAHKDNLELVQGQSNAQGTAPGTQPDASGVDTEAAKRAAAANTAFSGAQATQMQNLGAGTVADAIYRDRQIGMGSTVANAYLGGWGYASPEAYSGALQAAAKNDPELGARLQAVGAAQHRGEKINEGDIKWIEDRADKALGGAQKSAREAAGFGKPQSMPAVAGSNGEAHKGNPELAQSPNNSQGLL